MNHITKAKTHLILDQPFFASLILSMPITEDNSIPTMATNGDYIIYNAEYMASLTLQETVFILAHETLHCVFDHMYRRGTRNGNKWNIAADYIINDLLTNDRIGVMPKGGLLDSNIVSQGKGTTEGVYNLLPDSDESKGAGQPGGALDQVQDAATDQASMSEKQNDMRVKVIQASNIAKMVGKLSAGMARVVKEVTATRTDWRSVLRRFLSERAKVDLSYAKPKRRFLAEDIYLPSLTGEKLGSIVIAVDCSGSVDDRLLSVFSNEIKTIRDDVFPSMVHVLYFDSKVLKVDSFSSDDSLELTPVGGGGTMFSPIFEYIETNDLSPVACVVLTDLMCSDFGAIPSYPVLWASVCDSPAPFGEILLIKE